MDRNVKIATLAAEKFNQLFSALMHHLANAGFAVDHLFRPVNKTELSDVMLGATDLDQTDRALIICIIQVCQW